MEVLFSSPPYLAPGSPAGKSPLRPAAGTEPPLGRTDQETPNLERRPRPSQKPGFHIDSYSVSELY